MGPFVLVVSGWLVAAPAVPPPLATPSALPVRRVVLYGNGVAFVERRGRVVGRAEVRLPVKPSQMDDVLKSVVVLDLGRGRIGAVGYDTPTPAEAGLGEVGFRLEPSSSGDCGTGGLTAVLRQLQGAQVVAATAGGPVAGRVLTVETRRTEGRDGQAVPSSHLVLAGEDGALVSVDLARVRSVQVLDGDARRDLDAFARATAAARRHDATTIVVSSEGRGERELVVGYTVASPVWKTTYRVVLDAAGQPFVQGWAIVENAGSDDWRDVRLSLVSGSPLSFIQHLQQPFYRHRPVLALPDGLRPEPQTVGLVRPWHLRAEEGLDLGVEGGVAGGVEGGVPGGVVGGVVGGLPDHVAPVEVPVEGLTTTLSDLVAAGSGVEARARPVTVGDLFDYRVEDPVSVPRGRSALIPILQQRLWGERVSFWGENEQGGERPLAALRLRNTSSLTLESGPITVIDGDVYAGEAQLDRLRPGEERFVRYATDLATLVETRTEEGRRPAFLVRVREGVFEAHYHRTRTTTYTVTNQSDRPRILYVEQSRLPRWELDESAPRPEQEERGAWRFRLELAPKSRADLPVTERLALMDRTLLASLSEPSLRELETRGLLDAASRAGLERVLALRARIAALEQEATAAEREAAEIAADQGRLRENVKAMGDRRDARELVARWLGRADAQEGRIEALRETRRRSEAERRTLRDEIDAVVRGLEGERRP
jgi:hypothetical protein